MGGFERIIVGGQGQLARQLATFMAEEGYEAELLVHHNPHLTGLTAPPESELNRRQVLERLTRTAARKTLVVNAAGFCIFPPPIAGHENLTIVNYHNSLLPAHRGSNAEAWQIYARDELGGISWHYVDSGLDTGDLIVQAAFKLDQDLTSLRLLKKQNDLALSSFQEIFQPLMSNRAPRRPQADHPAAPHRKREIPNQGFLEPSWPLGRISAFLRGMDYGYLKILGEPRLEYEGRLWSWKKYSLDLAPEDAERPGRLFRASDAMSFESGRSRIVLEKISVKEPRA